MATAIRFILTNLPFILFVLAVVIAATKRNGPTAYRYLSWFLLLSVGVSMIWAGIFHIFFPAIARAQIGWQASPFEFEIGVADLSAGIVAVISFWRGLEFKAAATWYVVLFYIGVAVGHVRQAVTAADYSPDNFGLLLLITVIQIFLLPILLVKARKEVATREEPALQGAAS